jgi:anti-sigma-K factor RskA
MMQVNHCDRLIDYFNDNLNQALSDQFEEHLLECEACNEELLELYSLTEDLPYASEPVTPPNGMKDRILSKVFVEENGTDKKEEEVTVRTFGTKKNKWLTPLLAASLLLSLLGNGYTILKNQNIAEGPGLSEEIDLVYKTMQMTPAEGLKNSSASASMIQQDNGMTVVIQAQNLQELKGDEAYQVWLIEGDQKYRAGTFVPNEKGEGAVVYPMEDTEKHQWEMIAITLEPTSTSQQPQGNIIFSSEL